MLPIQRRLVFPCAHYYSMWRMFLKSISLWASKLAFCKKKSYDKKGFTTYKQNRNQNNEMRV